MEKKTKVNAEEGQQFLTITREFELPVELLFKAYEDPAIIEQWMGTKVLKLESRPHGSYQYETTDAQGKVLFRGNGVIHTFVPNEKITRTFEMENAGFDVQLEFLEFEKLTDDTSKLTSRIVYKSAAHRDQNLKLPFAYGINMAHDRLQEVVSKIK
jgi:uncharacterized protein YndB with AHSA1/START domain